MMTLALLLALVGPQDLSPAVKKKIDAARAAVEKAPDDAKANLELGKLLCFDAGAWDDGLPHLAKGGDKAYATPAEADLAGGNPLERIAVADQWLELGKKQKALRAACTDRALALYGEAWPKLMDEVWKGKLRERVAALQRKAPESKSLGAFPSTSWRNESANQRCGIDREYVRTGAAALKILAPDPKGPSIQSWISSQHFPCAAGAKVAWSAWVLTSGGEGFDTLQVKFRDEKQSAGEAIKTASTSLNADVPVWVKVEGEVEAPAGTVRVEISYNKRGVTGGATFLDDVSLTIDGREVLKNGGFELR